MSLSTLCTKQSKKTLRAALQPASVPFEVEAFDEPKGLAALPAEKGLSVAVPELECPTLVKAVLQESSGARVLRLLATVPLENWQTESAHAQKAGPTQQEVYRKMGIEVQPRKTGLVSHVGLAPSLAECMCDTNTASEACLPGPDLPWLPPPAFWGQEEHQSMHSLAQLTAELSAQPTTTGAVARAASALSAAASMLAHAASEPKPEPKAHLYSMPDPLPMHWLLSAQSELCNRVQLLEQPVMDPMPSDKGLPLAKRLDLSTQTVPYECANFAELLAECCSFMDLAAEMTQDDSSLTLPPIMFDSDESLGPMQAGTCLQEMAARCGLKKASTAHLELQMHWLATQGLPADVQRQLEQLEQHTAPKKLPDRPYASTEAAVIVTAVAGGSLGSRQMLPPELVPWHVLSHLQPQEKLSPAMAAAAAVNPQLGAAPYSPHAVGATHTSHAQTVAGGAGVLVRRLRQPERGHQQGQDSMSFFRQLQGPLGDQAVASASASQTSSEDISLGTETVRTRLELPDTHRRLLVELQHEHNRVVRSTDDLPAAVRGSPYLDCSAVQEAIATAASQQPGLCPTASGLEAERAFSAVRTPHELLKKYALLLVLKQSGIALVHYGIRCAHLLLSHAATSFSQLNIASSSVAQQLCQAHVEVDRDALPDHPKLHALHNLLRSTIAVKPAAKMLLVGDHRAFLTMYRVVTDAGLRAFQLDRSQQLAAAGQQPAALAAAAAAAAGTADCVLVTYAQVTAHGFPMHMFNLLVEYAPQALAEEARAAEAVLQGAHCARHVLEVDPCCPAAHAGSAPAGRPAEACANPAGQTGSTMAQERPLVINAAATSLLQQRRALYEAMLRLEKQGVIIVERDMQDVDIVISPAACLCIWGEPDVLAEAGSPDSAADAMENRLARISCAFSQALVCLEGSKAFIYKCALQVERLHRVAAVAGLSLQLLWSDNLEHTQGIVTTAVNTMLQQLAAAPSTEAVSLPPQPTEHEAFLNAFPSLNPLSSTAILSCSLPLRDLLNLGPSERDNLAWELPQVPRHALDLMWHQLQWGKRILPLGPAGSGVSAVSCATQSAKHHMLADEAAYDGSWHEQQQQHQHQQQHQQQQHQQWQQQQQRPQQLDQEEWAQQHLDVREAAATSRWAAYEHEQAEVVHVQNQHSLPHGERPSSRWHPTKPLRGYSLVQQQSQQLQSQQQLDFRRRASQAHAWVLQSPAGALNLQGADWAVQRAGNLPTAVQEQHIDWRQEHGMGLWHPAKRQRREYNVHMMQSGLERRGQWQPQPHPGELVQQNANTGLDEFGVQLDPDMHFIDSQEEAVGTNATVSLSAVPNGHALDDHSIPQQAGQAETHAAWDTGHDIAEGHGLALHQAPHPNPKAILDRWLEKRRINGAVSTHVRRMGPQAGTAATLPRPWIQQQQLGRASGDAVASPARDW